MTITIHPRHLFAATAMIVVTLVAVVTLAPWRVGALQPGETTFVPIVPCRLFDTRPGPDNVGPRSAPIGAKDPYTLQVSGQNGSCNIPLDADAVAMNVTAVDATAPSFLQLWPADAPRPARGSSLNYLPGQAPTPNKVDVKLSASGAVKIYNLDGTVNVLGDVVGYYTDAGLKDLEAQLQQLSAEVDAILNTTAKIPSGITVTGDGLWDHAVVSPGSDVQFEVELPFLPPTKLTSGDVNLEPSLLSVSNSGQINAACSGTYAAPTAPPGKVCIYSNAQVNIDSLAGYVEKGERSFRISFISDTAVSAGDDMFLSYSWAYTAP